MVAGLCSAEAHTHTHQCGGRAVHMTCTLTPSILLLVLRVNP